MIASVFVGVAFLVGFVCGRLYRSDAQADAARWADEYKTAWLEQAKRTAELERDLAAAITAKPP